MRNQLSTPRPCLTCGNSFSPRVAHLAVGWGKYCSPRCGYRGRAKKPIEDRFWAKVQITDACWLWTAHKSKKNYGLFMLSKRVNVYAHRLAWELANGPIPDGLDVLHACDVPNCIRNDDPGIYVVDGIEYPRSGHLWLGTHADNMRDMAVKGRAARKYQSGEANSMVKLTSVNVQAIRTRHAEGTTFAQLANEFNVVPTTIAHVIKRRTWAHVP